METTFTSRHSQLQRAVTVIVIAVSALVAFATGSASAAERSLPQERPHVVSEYEHAAVSPEAPIVVEVAFQRAVPRPQGIAECFAGITALGGGIASWSAWAVASSIVSLFQCGRWLGTYTVDAFCWTTRQWWGWNSRSALWTASRGRYTRC